MLCADVIENSSAIGNEPMSVGDGVTVDLVASSVWLLVVAADRDWRLVIVSAVTARFTKLSSHAAVK
jgi:hypothetical protein